MVPSQRQAVRRGGEAVVKPIRNLTVYRDISECYEKFERQHRLGLDLETSGLSPYKDDIAVVVVADDSGNVLVQHVWADGWPTALTHLLNRDDVEWVSHNGYGFDWLFLLNNGINRPQLVYDTLIGEQVLIYQNRRNVRRDLASTMKRRLGVNLKKEMDHSGWTRNYLNEEQVEYASFDAANLIRVQDAQLEWAVERRMQDGLEFEQRVARSTTKVMHNGMACPLSNLKQRRVELFEEAKEATSRVVTAFPGLNVNSPQQVVARVNQALGLDIPNARKETLLEYKEAHPLLDDIVTAKAAIKRTGFYDDEWTDRYIIGDRLFGHFWPTGANTLRFTSSNPNLQQIPRNMRRIIGNEPGLVVVSADYAQIEVRMLAFYARDHLLIQACQDDIHTFMARAMFSIPPDEYVAKDDERRSPLGKYGTFSWGMGGSYKAVVRSAAKNGTQLPEATAKQMIRGLNNRFKPSAALIRRAGELVKAGNLVVMLPHGNRRAFLPGEASRTKWLNTTFQGSAAAGFKEGLLEMDERGVIDYVGGLVHDEFVATGVPEEIGEDFAAEMSDCMILGMERMMEDVQQMNPKSTFIPVPVEVETKVGATWA